MTSRPSPTAAMPDPASTRRRERNTVERCFSKLKQFRAVAIRCDKRQQIYQGTVDMASIRIWLRDPPHDLQDTPQRDSGFR